MTSSCWQVPFSPWTNLLEVDGPSHTRTPLSSQWSRLTLPKHTEKDKMEREKEKNSSSVLIWSLLHIWFAINGENSEKREYIQQHATFTSTILNYITLKIYYSIRFKKKKKNLFDNWNKVSENKLSCS